jgi:hypothetical protein
MSARKPAEARELAETVVTNLRIKESLRRALELEAQKNQVSLSREMVRRLEESLQSGAKFDLAALTDVRKQMERVGDDLLATWLRVKGRFQAREHEEAILQAVEDNDLETAREHALVLRKLQEAAVRKQTERLSSRAPEVVVGPGTKGG